MRVAIAAALLAIAAAPARADGDSPYFPGPAWQLGVTGGLGTWTYPSSASLHPAARPQLFPTGGGHCDTCITSLDESVSGSLARRLGPILYVGALFVADRAPDFGDHIMTGAAGVGVTSFGGTTWMLVHGGLFAGVSRTIGPVDATSAAFGLDWSFDLHVGGDLYAGIAFTFLDLRGAQPAGDATAMHFGADVRYVWR